MSKAPFELKYVGPPPSLWVRLKVWWYLDRCKRIIWREMEAAAEAEASKVFRK